MNFESELKLNLQEKRDEMKMKILKEVDEENGKRKID